MKLLFAVVQNDDVKRLTKSLVKHEISVTRISSTGGFLSGGNTTLMIGVEEDRLQETLAIIKNESSRREALTAASCVVPGGSTDCLHTPLRVTVGGATVFVVEAREHYKF